MSASAHWRPRAPALDKAWQFSPVVVAAVKDPEGARAYLLTLGEILGYPAEELGPVPCEGGKEAWSMAIAGATSHLLGLAARYTLRQEISGVRELKAPEAQGAQSAKKERQVTIVKPSAGGGAQLADGYYPAVVSDITENSRDWPSRNDPSKMETVHQFIFQFVILDQDGKRTEDELRGYVRQAWSQRATLFAWASAILGRKCPKPDDEFDTDSLKGRKCDLEVVNQRSQAGAEYSKVAKVYPYRSMSVEEEETEEVPAQA